MKEIAPENSFGTYLTIKNISNVEIYSKTGIPVSDLSKMRNGEIKSIPAKRLYLISLISGDPIAATLEAVYPNLLLVHEIDPASNKIKATTTPVGSVLFSLEQHTFEIISYKTGIKLSRLRNLATKESAVILSHELYLIEMACNRKPGSLFDKLFKGLKLNSPTEQNRLQNEAED
ncbi:hypothetical protein WAE58_04545 [Pedobacter panaciterrae]|uniref:Uncharacterized protein n=1 Tax=Pedobacter panaciterrae TaxID=363849 RepID=A0ABU8NHE6_9SPHI